MGVTIRHDFEDTRASQVLEVDGAEIDAANPIPVSVTNAEIDVEIGESMDLGEVSVCELKTGGAPMVSKALGATPSTNAAFDANVPAGTKYVELYSASACLVALGEATDATHGRWVPAGLPVTMRLNDADVAAGKKLNAQSPVANAVVYATYLAG
jgi:hypothetical protein